MYSNSKKAVDDDPDSRPITIFDRFRRRPSFRNSLTYMSYLPTRIQTSKSRPRNRVASMFIRRILSPGGSSGSRHALQTSNANSSASNLRRSTRQQRAPTNLEGYTASSGTDDNDLMISRYQGSSKRIKNDNSESHDEMAPRREGLQPRRQGLHSREGSSSDSEEEQSTSEEKEGKEDPENATAMEIPRYRGSIRRRKNNNSDSDDDMAPRREGLQPRRQGLCSREGSSSDSEEEQSTSEEKEDKEEPENATDMEEDNNMEANDGEGEEEEEDKDGNDDEEDEEQGGRHRNYLRNRSEVQRFSIEESKQQPGSPFLDDSYVSVSKSLLHELLLAANSLTAAHEVFKATMHKVEKIIRQGGECSKKHKELLAYDEKFFNTLHEVVLQVKERSLKLRETEDATTEGQNKESSAKGGGEQAQTVNDQRVTSLTGIGMRKSSTPNIQKALEVQNEGEENEDEEVEDNEQLLKDVDNAFEEDESDA